MPEKLTEFDAAEYITTAERARLYLDACAEEDPGDGSMVRAALNDIARAHGTQPRSELLLCRREHSSPSLTSPERLFYTPREEHEYDGNNERT